MKKVLSLIFISFNIFSGYVKEINNLLEKNPKEIEIFEQSLNDEKKKELCKYLISNYTKTFLQVIKPGLASFPYISNRKFKELNKNYDQCKLVSDGKILLAINFANREADIWSLTEEEPQLIKSVQLPLGTKHVEISQDAKYIVTRVNHGDTITVFNLEANKSKDIPLMNSNISNIAISPDSKFMLVAYSFEMYSKIYEFNFDTEKLELLWQIKSCNYGADRKIDSIKSISISKDGKYALYSNSYSVYLYDSKENKNKKIEGITENNIKFCTFVPNGQFAYVLAEGPAFDKCYCVSIKDAKAIYCLQMQRTIEFSFFGNDTRWALARDGYFTGLINLDQFSDSNVMKLASFNSVLWRSSICDCVNPQGTLLVTINLTGLLAPGAGLAHKKPKLYDTSGWAIEELSLTALLVLLKIDQSKEQKEVLEYLNFLFAYFQKRHSLFHEELEKFVRKKLVALSYEAPQELQNLVKEFI